MPDRALTIGFDADDTLWHNQPIFERSYERFRELLSRFHDPVSAGELLLATELKNVPLYGYGIKGYTLSAIETAITLSNGEISSGEIRQLLDAARDMLQHPVELLDGAPQILASLAGHHRMIVITKGDLHDQERKIGASGLSGYFDHIEVVSEKNSTTYAKILSRHGIQSENFLMVGNSLKSDILPVLAIGGYGAHLPYHVTWGGELAEEPVEFLDRYFKLGQMSDLPGIIRRLTW